MPNTPTQAATPAAGKPGFFEARRERTETERYEGELATWTEEDTGLRDLQEQARTFTGDPHESGGFVLHRDERTFLIASGVVLIEPRVTRGEYVGGSRGASLRIAKSVSYRVGQSRGTYQPGPSRPIPTDDSDAIITNKRVIFRGTKAIREWRFDRLVGMTHSADGYWTALQVSNRQKVSGLGYGPDHAKLVRFRLELAVAEWRGARADVVADLGQQVASHQSLKPVDPRLQR